MMNVKRTMEDVIIFAIIHLAALSAPVMKATLWNLMVLAVLVRQFKG